MKLLRSESGVVATALTRRRVGLQLQIAGVEPLLSEVAFLLTRANFLLPQKRATDR